MTFAQREAMLKTNKISLTECKCDNCGHKSIINKDDGFYCVNCGSYPIVINYGASNIINKRSG
jgi:Zn finger protein HypA/HybF involved in hydrogenase expression